MKGSEDWPQQVDPAAGEQTATAAVDVRDAFQGSSRYWDMALADCYLTEEAFSTSAWADKAPLGA